MTAKIFLPDEAWEKDCFFLFVVGDHCDVIYKYLCYKTLQGQERKAWGLILLSQTPAWEHLKMLTFADVSQAMSLEILTKQTEIIQKY